MKSDRWHRNAEFRIGGSRSASRCGKVFDTRIHAIVALPPAVAPFATKIKSKLEQNEQMTAIRIPQARSKRKVCRRFPRWKLAALTPRYIAPTIPDGPSSWQNSITRPAIVLIRPSYSHE